MVSTLQPLRPRPRGWSRCSVTLASRPPARRSSVDPDPGRPLGRGASLPAYPRCRAHTGDQEPPPESRCLRTTSARPAGRRRPRPGRDWDLRRGFPFAGRGELLHPEPARAGSRARRRGSGVPALPRRRRCADQQPAGRPDRRRHPGAAAVGHPAVGGGRWPPEVRGHSGSPPRQMGRQPGDRRRYGTLPGRARRRVLRAQPRRGGPSTRRPGSRCPDPRPFRAAVFRCRRVTGVIPSIPRQMPHRGRGSTAAARRWSPWPERGTAGGDARQIGLGINPTEGARLAKMPEG